MAAPADIVFLFDVDNTLLDNDQVHDDLHRELVREFGAVSAQQYWIAFEQLRAEVGYADYLGALQRYRLTTGDDPRLLLLSGFMLDYPFAKQLYPGALDSIEHVSQWGPVAILSDGDVVFQPRKIQHAGLWNAVAGNVLIYVHKEKMIGEIERRYPATHYVMIDDKLRILDAMKTAMGERLTTVFVRQGHYARDTASLAAFHDADVSIDHIADLIRIDRGGF